MRLAAGACLALVAVCAGRALPAPAAACTRNTTAAEVVRGHDLTGQMHVLTGGDSGIGYAAALAVASANASVVIAGHSEAKCAAAAANISRLTGNPRVVAVAVDLGNFTSVRACAAQIRAVAPAVDVLVCDAGIGVSPRGLPTTTADGFERVVEVDFLGHFLLVQMLLPSLRARRGRVVHVSSAASFAACAWASRPDNCTALASLDADVRTAPKGNSSAGLPASNYGLGKFLQVFHAAELARREPGVQAFSLHPGFVATGITHDLPPQVVRAWCKGSPKPCPLPPEMGAATAVFLATAPAHVLAPHDGAYFQQCAPATSVVDKMAAATSAEAVQRYQAAVFAMTMNWTGAGLAAPHEAVV